MLEEEPLYESPLDKINVYIAFRNFIGGESTAIFSDSLRNVNIDN